MGGVYYTRVVGKDGKKRARCNRCGLYVSTVSVRLTKHLTKCLPGFCSLMPTGAVWWLLSLFGGLFLVVISWLPLHWRADAWRRPPPPKVPINFITGPIITRKIARAVYATNTPFAWIQQPAVLDMLRTLGAGSHIPSKYALSGALLTWP